MLLNRIHPSFDWLCVEPLYTVQVLTEGSTAWELMDQMPPLAGSNRGYHGSMTLSDAFFGQYPCPYFTVSCQDQRSQAAYYVCRTYPLGCTRRNDYEPRRRTWSPMRWLAPVRPLAFAWAWNCFSLRLDPLAECWILMAGCLWWLLCPRSHDSVEPWTFSSFSLQTF